MNRFQFSPINPPGLTANARDKLVNKTAFEFFSLFIDDEILGLLVNESNRYAEQCSISSILKEEISYVIE